MFSSKHTTPARLLLVAAIAGLLAAACGGSSGASGSSSNISGEVIVSGSSTVEPISTLVAEKFQADNPNVKISVDGPGTGDGFVLFCKGETDVSDASRPIEPDEQDACAQNGIDYIELKIGIDGISVITSPENDQVDCLDYKDLYALLGPESKGFANWSDADQLGQEIGAGHVPYPDAPLQITAPGEESGTYDSFAELVLASTAEERKIPEDNWLPRPDYQSSPNDNVIIEGVSGSPTSLGWVGFAFYDQNKDKVNAISIDGGDGNCVEPSTETIGGGTYPISRNLYVYVNAKKAKSNKALAKFISFYMSKDGLASVTEADYVAQPASVLQQTKAVWSQRETGTREG